ncbi:tyrosine--tRNA ligase, partial [Streptomyces sp. SID10244]|nr:tyrosine--tRNA ligase [Streptomyces sp. SID10244]
SSDGKKFGKSTGGGSLWLDPELTSPYAWYQYFVNTADADVVRYLKWFTFLGREEIAELERVTEESPHLRTAQKRLAAEMTTLIHGEHHTESAELASQALFGRAELADLDEQTLAAAVGETTVADYAGTQPTIVELLVDTALSESNKAARRAIGEGGAYVNNEKITDPQWRPEASDLLHG